MAKPVSVSNFKEDDIKPKAFLAKELSEQELEKVKNKFEKLIEQGKIESEMRIHKLKRQLEEQEEYDIQYSLSFQQQKQQYQAKKSSFSRGRGKPSNYGNVRQFA